MSGSGSLRARLARVRAVARRAFTARFPVFIFPFPRVALTAVRFSALSVFGSMRR